MDLIVPDWPAPANVHALFTTRVGGFSSGVYKGLNLGSHVQDDFDVVIKNRTALKDFIQLKQEPVWLNQVHGTEVYSAEKNVSEIPTADAAVTHVPLLPLTVMTADCLPLLFCNMNGTVVATAHAGWRGLCHGVIENTLDSMNVSQDEILVWLGPAIGPSAFEVGSDVKDAFLQCDPKAERAFQPSNQVGKYLANLYELARLRLEAKGVTHIYGGDHCTFTDCDRFYSYRRDGQTGRMAGMIWLSNKS